MLSIELIAFQFVGEALHVIVFDKTTSLLFTLGVIATTILYILAALYTIYKFSPKTFKLK